MERRPHRPAEQAKAEASKARALAHLRWHQLRVMRREYKPVADFDATLARVLAMIRDRFMALPDRVNLTAEQRQQLRRQIAETLEACSHAEL